MRVKSDIFANLEGSPSAQVKTSNRSTSQSMVVPTKSFKRGAR